MLEECDRLCAPRSWHQRSRSKSAPSPSRASSPTPRGVGPPCEATGSCLFGDRVQLAVELHVVVHESLCVLSYCGIGRRAGGHHAHVHLGQTYRKLFNRSFPIIPPLPWRTAANSAGTRLTRQRQRPPSDRAGPRLRPPPGVRLSDRAGNRSTLLNMGPGNSACRMFGQLRPLDEASRLQGTSHGVCYTAMQAPTARQGAVLPFAVPQAYCLPHRWAKP